ncbi:hypothetical protein Pla52n_27670 [Stieleria varia]|uniref:Uncharacterized protein n=1 Tax=Stieleria varia TaxID=2528005 RepID=A0A5C6B2R3_9BACT|nr:hypothetical protein Pla52n_27670 [Stieleria varia]
MGASLGHLVGSLIRDGLNDGNAASRIIPHQDAS